MSDDLKKYLKLFENSNEKIKYKDIIEFIELRKTDEEERATALFSDMALFAASLVEYFERENALKNISMFGPQADSAYSNFIDSLNILMEVSNKVVEPFKNAGVDVNDYYYNEFLEIWNDIVKDNSDPLDHMTLEEFFTWIKGIGVWQKTYGKKNPLDVMTIKDFILWVESNDTDDDWTKDAFKEHGRRPQSAEEYADEDDDNYEYDEDDED